MPMYIALAGHFVACNNCASAIAAATISGRGYANSSNYLKLAICFANIARAEEGGACSRSQLAVCCAFCYLSG